MARVITPATREITLAGDYRHFTPDMIGVATMGAPVSGGPLLLTLFKNVALPATPADEKSDYSVVYQLHSQASLDISLETAKDLLVMLQEAVDKIEAGDQTTTDVEK